jgi:hypothetical protein
MWVGQVVHEMIELALGAWRRGEEAPLEGLVERGTRSMRAQYAESMQRVYWDKPLTALGLVEHEFDEQVERDEWRARRDHMEACLRTFYDLELTAEIRALPRWRWLALESAGTFELDGAVIFVKPDFAWRDDDDRVVMVDWKTGIPRHDEEDTQLAVYGMFARRAWGLGSDHMRALAVYLGRGEVRERRVDLGDLKDAEQTIVASLQRMRELAGDDPTTPESQGRFPMTDDLEHCRRCAFRRVCDRE